MKQYDGLVAALRPMTVSHVYMDQFLSNIERVAKDIHRRNQHRSYDDVFVKCLRGTVIEHGIQMAWNTQTIWSRFSKQNGHESYKFDLAVIQKNLYEQWLPNEIRVDAKSSNSYCNGPYFAFNCYNTKDKAQVALQAHRVGANLHFFINESSDTELLITADLSDTDNGWIVTPKYLIHRDAFLREFNITGWADSPYFYLHYNDLIRAELCVRIPLY
jgi:hypothetical protein